MKKYVLTLSPDYVLNWEFWEAIRELLQNAIDQRKTNEESKLVFQYHPEEQMLIIGSTNCSLEPKTLLLGVSNKRDSQHLIGQFGEGFKLALLVLTRLSYEVIVINNDVVWTPKFEFSTEFGCHVLTIEETEAETPMEGVYFQIRDVKTEKFEDILEKYVPNMEDNQILTEDHFKHKVFVSGLFVCEIKELEFGYNFSPDRIRLDRDRRMAPTFEVTYEASRLWQAHQNEDQVYQNLKKGIPDVQYISYGGAVGKYVVQKFIQEHPDTIPVCSQAEIERHKGYKFCLVPEPLRNLLRQMHAFVFNREGTPSAKLEHFYHLFKNQLNSEATREMKALLEDSKKWSAN